MKNTFMNLALINIVACVALLNNSSYTYQMNMMFEEVNQVVPNNNVLINKQENDKRLKEIANKKELPEPVKENVTEYLELMNQDVKNKDKFLKKLARTRSLIDIHKDTPKEVGTAHPNSGLNNICFTCYMNAVLQLFAGLPDFVKSFFKVIEYEDNYDKLMKTASGIVTLEFANVMAEVISGGYKNENDPTEYTENTSFSPKSFKAVISKNNPLFQGIQANDSKDLWLYIVETMHNALNTTISNNIQQNTNIDPTNYQQVFNNFSEEFIKNYASALSRYFYCATTTTTKCLNCSTIKYNCQIQNISIDPLEEVRKRRDMVFPSCQGKPLLLQDLFAYNEKLETFTGPSAMYCNNCHKTCNAHSRTKFEYLPNVLVINLNRGKGNAYDVRLSIPQFLDAGNFTNQNIPEKFALLGFVCHIGPSNSAGHFVYFGKKSPDAPWYRYNDSLVSEEVDEKLVNEILSGQNGNMVPYLVIWGKLNNAEAEKYKDKMVTLTNNYPQCL